MPHDIWSNPPQRPRQGPPKQLRRRGFTLIEMLVVIGIILLLIGMSVAGFSQIARHSKAQHTKAALETMRAMMDEYEATAGKNAMTTFRANWDNEKKIGGVPVAQPITPGPASTYTINLNNYSTGATTPLAWQDYSDMVLADLLSVPNNRAILGKLPTDQVEPTTLPNGNSSFRILDGYGHPLRFVPSAGVIGMTTQDPRFVGQKLLMQSDGQLRTPPASATNQAANPRPFWFSAGADGDYLSSDDNQYTFGQ